MKVSTLPARNSSSQGKELAVKTDPSFSTRGNGIHLALERERLGLTAFDKFATVGNPYLKGSALSGVRVDGNVLRTLKYGFGKLFGPSSAYHVHRHLDHCSLYPPCFSFPRSVPSNPFGSANDLFKQISQQFSKRFEGFSKSNQTAGPSLSYERSGAPAARLHREKGKDVGLKIVSPEIDRMMALAGKLLSPDSSKDQPAGQKVLAQTHLMQLLSKLNGQQAQTRRTDIR